MTASDTVDRQCHRNDQVTVLGQPNPAAVGTSFTARPTTPILAADCLFERRPSDIVVGRPGEPYFYVALEGTTLILDKGTSPDRLLEVIDARTGKPILEAFYAVPAEGCDPTKGCVSDDFRYNGTSLTFWRGTRVPPTVQNCPQLRKWKADGLVPVIVERTVLHFAAAKAEGLKARRCVATQGGYDGPYRINGVSEE